MAWTAGSFPTKIRAVSGLGFKGEPYTLHGYLTVNYTAREGDVLANSAGALTRTTNNVTAGTIIGVLPSISPEAKDSDQTPRQRITNATIADRTKYDPEKSVAFYCWVSGNIFMGHLTTDESVDATADSNLNIYINTNPFLATNDWSFGITGANAGGSTIGFVNPQTSTISGTNTFVNSPGPVKNSVGDTNGTKNPLVLVLPKSGRLIAAS